MYVIGITGEKYAQYQKGKSKIELSLHSETLNRILIFGQFENMHALCNLLLEDVKISHARIAHFEKTGEMIELIRQKAS